MSFKLKATLATTVIALAACTSAQADHHSSKAIKKFKTSEGTILTDAKGMTLYTFDKDQAGISNCYDGCAAAWPPLMAAKGAHGEGDYSVVTRKDGNLQWAYKGKPLYTWMKDEKQGDMTGDGVKGVWHVIKVKKSGYSY